MAWLNTLLRQLWPHLDAAITRKVLDAVAAALAGGVGMGMAVHLNHFSLGARPLTLCGVRALGDPGAADTPDSCVLDIDVRLASTEPNAVAVISGGALAATPLTLELAALQVHATLRVSFRLLSAKLPPFDAITVSLLSTPFLDFSLRALEGDLLAIPGLEATVARAVKGAVSAYLWPLRIAVPLTAEAAEAASLHPRSRGVLLIRLRAARNLPATDLSTMSTDPYGKLHIVGQPNCYVETAHKSRTRKPHFNLSGAMLPVTDVRTQSLALEMWDANAMSADELVSTALLPLAEALGLSSESSEGAEGGEVDASGKTFSGWVPLTRADVGVGDITSHLTSLGGGLRSMVRMGAKEPGKEGGTGGDAHIAFTFVPFARPGTPPAKLPPGWRLPSPSPAILSVRLLRARNLHLPAGWHGAAHPFITARVGKTVLKSAPGRGTSPGWLDEVLCFTSLDLSSVPSSLLRLQLTVSAGKLSGGVIPGASAVTGAIGGAIGGAAGLVTGVASAVTLGNVDLRGATGGGGGESALKLHSRSGGILGRRQRSAAESAAEGESPPEELSDAAFCGRIEPLTLAEIQKACLLAGGPVTFTRPLREVPTGDVTFIAELHTFNAEESSEAAAADVTSESALPTAASEASDLAALPVTGGGAEGAPSELAAAGTRRAKAAVEEAQMDADAEEAAAAGRGGCAGCTCFGGSRAR